MGLPLVQVDGERATAFNYSCVFRPDGEERFFPWRVSANRCDLVRTGMGWKIERRVNRLMTGDPDTLALLRGADAIVGRRDGISNRCQCSTQAIVEAGSPVDAQPHGTPKLGSKPGRD